jgi:TrmH family RNA methyltransferase
MKLIASAANPAFKRWLRAAASARFGREQGIALAEGLHLAEAALQAGVEIETLLLRRGADRATIDPLVDRARAQGTACIELSADLYDRLDLVRNGVGLSVVLRIPQTAAPQAGGDLLFLDGVQDPGNAGGLMRTALAAGVSSVVFGPGSAGPWSSKVLRAAQGAHFALRLADAVPVAEAKKRFGGLWVAAAAHGAASLWDARLPAGPVAWVFGAEGQGLSVEALQAVDLSVTIPLQRPAESLNVAAAAAVCLFERRRRLAEPAEGPPD